MRVLTVRQPWAWAIVHGGKDVENRSRNLAGSYRGPVAIHAGKVFDDDALWDLTFLRSLPSPGNRAAWEAFKGRHVLGAVIGVVDLIDTHQHLDDGTECSTWAEPGAWHLEVGNPVALVEPVPARGKLGLWTPDRDIADAIAANLPT